jgi:hypothetical protein
MADQFQGFGSSNVTTFYTRIVPFEDFSQVFDSGRYLPAPPDWLVVVADIEGSTEAARAGRYKEVNLLGAACITAVLNSTRGLDLPYTFGGDGASLLIPAARRDVVVAALARLKRLAAREFGLKLRLGVVPVEEILRRGKRILVAKFALSPDNYLAMFAGGGIALADHLVKNEQAFAIDVGDDETMPDLEGLSCRWQPCRAERGVMLTLLVRPLEADAGPVEREVLDALETIVGGALPRAAPVTRRNTRFLWPPAGLEAEARLARGRVPLWRRRLWLYVETFMQRVADRFDLHIGPYDAPAYRDELRRNSDYRKVADTLHMVLDCTPEESTAIRACLAGRHDQGQLVFGLHESDRAMMTCVVFSLEESRHVHFVDGADGGYGIAALELKRQLQENTPEHLPGD